MLGNFRRVRVLFQQLPVFLAVRCALLEVLRKVLDPFATLSYSQGGEDRTIHSFFGDECGFFVDVGCNHPIRASNTFALYKRGWRGLSIDANLKLIREHKRLRPRDIAICEAVSDSKKEMLYTEFNDSLVSSLSLDHVRRWQGHREILSQKLVNTTPLNEILLANNVPRDFSLLCVDVEGHDYEVLHSIDFDVFRPRLIIVELNPCSVDKAIENPIKTYLNENGYDMVAYATMNAYFLRRPTQRL
jgi:FkbM family methyltransferase